MTVNLNNEDHLLARQPLHFGNLREHMPLVALEIM